MSKTLVTLMCAMVLSAASGFAMAVGQTSDPTPKTVRMKGMQFDPQSVTVQAGQTVQFVNDDQVTHNVVDSGDNISSGDIEAGKSWNYTFTKAGDYQYVCTYHSWMKGEVKVNAAK